MASRENRTYLGIDYGARRIGLAKSDPTGLIASPLTTLEVKSAADALKKLSAVISEYSPDGLVFGYPLHDSGEKSDKCREVDAFIKRLAAEYGGPIYRVDEGHSSREAVSIIHAHGKQAGRNKKLIDRLAAVVILQRFLDEQPDQSHGRSQS
ncbi:MAG TPA: Holliday junction resolvase RuvX [Acidobacteriota bacterium]|nr:Holliday junction resolvase RuvX [Acidobacteriota bacterium]